MGYTVSGGGTIRVRPHQEAEAVAALQAWSAKLNANGEHIGYAGNDQAERIAAATTVAAIFSTFLDVTESDEPGAFDVWNDDSWSEDNTTAAELIGPYCEPSTNVEWQGEEGEHFRWRFTGTEMVEDYGTVTYEDDEHDDPERRTPDARALAAVRTTRAHYFAALRERHGGDPDEWPVPDEYSPPPEALTSEGPDDLDRYALVEENVRGSTPPYWISTHPTPAAAALHHVNQEYAEDWEPVELVDLDTGEIWSVDYVYAIAAAINTTGWNGERLDAPWPLMVTDEADYREWMKGANVPVDPEGTGEPVTDWTTCGTCGRTWNDAAITGRTPTPSARCPFEDEHRDPPRCITLPLDAQGNPLAWPDGTGGWVDAWRGVYATTDDLARELPHWTARPSDRTLAFGQTRWEAE